MRTVSQGYAEGANKNIRNVNVTIKNINDTVMYSASDIISISVQKCITDGSLGIGFASSDRLNLQVVSARKIPKMTWLRVYVSFDGHDEIFGKFVCDECTRDGSVITITAYDAMYYQSKKTVKFTGAPDLQLEALTFPCSMQDMLNYICRLRNITTDFVCQSFTVSELPQKDESNFYSVRELIGFIAACHGCNAKLDPSNKLIIKPFEAVNYTANTSDVIDLTIDDSEPFEVTGVLFTVNNETSIYIDDVEGSEYDEDDVGVITCFNPLATVEIAEYVWSQIGGLSYYGGNLTQRGKGIIEVGDVITVGNLKYPADTGTYPLCVTSIDYSITADGGFVETLGSDAAKSSEQMSSGAGGSSSGGGSGTGVFLDDAHTSVAHNDVENNTSEGTYDSVDGYHNTITGTGSKANTVTGEYNTLTASKDNIVSGNNNTVTASNNCNVSGWNNTVIQCDRSVITGMSGQYTNCYSILAATNGNMRVNNASRSLLVGDINGGWYNGSYLPTGGQIYETEICGHSIAVQANSDVAYSVIFGTGHTIGASGSYAAAIFGQEHTINNPNSSIIGGMHNNVSQSWRCIVTGEENIVNSSSNSAVFGYGHLVQSSTGATIIGQYGQVTNSNRAFVIGNGNTTSARANIFEVDWNGNVTASGTITPSGADYAEYFEWADGNPENEDRRGMLVTLDGDKIVLANGDDILGVISGCASVIGNAYDLHWCGKYATDVYGGIITTPKGERIVSPDYDPNREYIPRSKRPEWSPVGLVGRLIVRDNGECKVGEFICGDNGYAFPCLVGKTNIRCLKRVDETHIEVLIK